VPTSIGQIILIRIYSSPPVLMNEMKDLTTIESTNIKKNIFSLMGDLNLISTSNKTIIENINKKK
jgi:hypothetical protein